MTGTATSRAGALGLAALFLLPAGCGGAARPPAPGAFAWLRPGLAPAGWAAVRIADGAVMPYPPGWHLSSGDAGTATATLTSHDHRFLGYLNVTPAQGAETTANWRRFRVAHNAREGDRSVRLLAGGEHLRFRTGTGACVRDSYTTTTGARFIELACLVTGTRASTVILGAAPPRLWSRFSPQIERAIASFTT